MDIDDSTVNKIFTNIITTFNHLEKDGKISLLKDIHQLHLKYEQELENTRNEYQGIFNSSQAPEFIVISDDDEENENNDE